jgi:hypothetical protein
VAAEPGKEARMLNPIFQPFVDQSPITVMAGAALARLLSAQRLDALFEKARQGQYAHQLLFSTVFGLMAAVVAGTRRSIHHAYQTATEEVGASVVAVYDKLKGIETCTAQSLVRDIAGELAPLIDQMGGALEPPAPGYRTKILDGNCIAASQQLPGSFIVANDAPEDAHLLSARRGLGPGGILWTISSSWHSASGCFTAWSRLVILVSLSPLLRCAPGNRPRAEWSGRGAPRYLRRRASGSCRRCCG